MMLGSEMQHGVFKPLTSHIRTRCWAAIRCEDDRPVKVVLDSMDAFTPPNSPNSFFAAAREA